MNPHFEQNDQDLKDCLNLRAKIKIFQGLTGALITLHGGYNRFKMFRCDVTHKLIFNINRKIIAENMRNWSDTYWHFVTSLAC